VRRGSGLRTFASSTKSRFCSARSNTRCLGLLVAFSALSDLVVVAREGSLDECKSRHLADRIRRDPRFEVLTATECVD
jgi:hypothetical protein